MRGIAHAKARKAAFTSRLEVLKEEARAARKAPWNRGSSTVKTSARATNPTSADVSVVVSGSWPADPMPIKIVKHQPSLSPMESRKKVPARKKGEFNIA